MLNPASSSVIFGRGSASSSGTSTAQREGGAPGQETTNKEPAIRRFEEELKKLQGRDDHGDHAPVANSSMNPAQKSPNSPGQLNENEQYAKALLIAVREEIYKKGYKSVNKVRAAPPGEDKNQWEKKEAERIRKANAEIVRIRVTTHLHPFMTNLAKQKAIEAKAHNCIDLSLAGIGILEAAGITDRCVVAFTNIDHGMVLIGKIPSEGLPLDIEKWPSHLAICDPWANIACPAREFIPVFMEKMQKWQEKAKKIVDKDDSGRTVLRDPHYPGLPDKLRSACQIFSHAPMMDMERKDAKGRTVLIIASQYGNVDAIQISLKAGADIEARNNQGLTPLLVAAYKGKTEVLDVLLKAGANIEAKDKKGLTALMKAVEMASSNKSSETGLHMLKTLLAAGADITFQDQAGKTAKEYITELATARNDKELLTLIEARP
jgi:hypothetical protein